MKITKLKNGKVSTRAYVGTDQDGKQKIERFTAESVSDLKKMILKRKLELAEHVRVSRSSGGTLRQAFKQFIEARDKVLSQTTVRAYLSIMNNSFQSLMEKDVNDITSEDIQREVNFMTPLVSSKTIKNKVALLHQVLENYSQNAPQTQIHMPPKTKGHKMRIPTKEEVDRMIEFCHSDPYYQEYELPIILGAYCGMRRGEIGALDYTDIDFKTSSLNVSKAQILDTGHEHSIKAPKTLAGYRTLPLNDEIMTIIKNRKKKGLPLIGVNVSQISSVFKTIKKRTGVNCRFHDLRHFFASLLLAHNVPDLYAIELTGHSTTSMLKNVYQHTMEQKQKEVRDTVCGFFHRET
jgi:integrase